MVADYSATAVVKPGEIIEGRYRIIETLGVGSMGSVYLAEHVLIKRRVAIKILRPELVEDADVLDGFMNEARAAGTLGHPNIVECTDMGLTRTDVPYIVLEYIEGVLLSDEIHRVGGLPLRRAFKIADRIAAALAAAHNAAIVHRDLKSDNVFLTDKEDTIDVVKVLDFGISRLLGARLDHGRALVMGTPEFMAPEQVTSPDSVDHRADIYALGVILYHMVTGHRPFTGDDKHALLHRVVHDAPPPLGLRGAPPGFEEMLFTKLLAKDPAQRYASMKSVQEALGAFATVVRPTGTTDRIEVIRPTRERPAEPPPPAEPAPSPASVAAPPAQPRSRSRGLGWVIAGALLAGIGGGLLYFESRLSAGSDRAIAATLESDAEKLAALLDSEIRAAHLRAEGIATTPMLRAAVETDAATLKDMFGSDFLFSPKRGEVLEVWQLRDRQPATSLLRIPDNAAPLTPITGNQTRITSDGTKITIVVSAPVLKQQSGVGGAVAITVPVDLAPLGKRIAEHVLSATVLGFGPPIPLVGGGAAGGAGPVASVVIPLSADVQSGEPTLTAVFPAIPDDGRDKLRLARLASWGLCGVLLVFYVVGLLRGRKRR